MKYIKLYNSAAEAIDTRETTPLVASVKNVKKSMYASKTRFGDNVLIVEKDDDFIQGYQYQKNKKDIVFVALISNGDAIVPKKMSCNFDGDTVDFNTSEAFLHLMLIKKTVIDNLIDLTSDWTYPVYGNHTPKFYYMADNVEYENIQTALQNFKNQFYFRVDYRNEDGYLQSKNFFSLQSLKNAADEDFQIFNEFFNLGSLNIADYQDGYYMAMVTSEETDSTLHLRFKNGMINIGKRVENSLPEDVEEPSDYSILYNTSDGNKCDVFEFQEQMMQEYLSMINDHYNIVSHTHDTLWEIKFDHVIEAVGQHPIEESYDPEMDDYTQYDIYPDIQPDGDGVLNITQLFLPKSLKRIYNTISRLSITSLTIPEGVEIIESSINTHPNLSYLTLPSTLQKIQGTCFMMCPNLYTIYYNGTAAQWNSIIKDNELGRGMSHNITIACTDANITLTRL